VVTGGSIGLKLVIGDSQLTQEVVALIVMHYPGIFVVGKEQVESQAYLVLVLDVVEYVVMVLKPMMNFVIQDKWDALVCADLIQGMNILS
jgi:hypothetical protein